MKMKLSSILVGALLAGATATSYASSSDNDAFSDAVAAIKSQPQMQHVNITVDPAAEQVQDLVGEDYVLIRVNESRFMTSKDGDILISPDQMFQKRGDGYRPVIESIIAHEIATHEGKWPSIPVPEGTDKVGDVYVFTDPTCGFCRQFEGHVDTYLESGIQVNYIPFVRAGADPSTQGYQLWAGALCSEGDAGKNYHTFMTDPNAAYEVPENGEACTQLISEGIDYGRLVGVPGTPYIFAQSDAGEHAVFRGLTEPSQVAADVGIFIRPQQSFGQ